MKRFMMVLALGMVAAAPAPSQTTAAIVKGYVIDSACAFLKNLDKPISKDCAVTCAKAGSPLVILAEDGTIYLPISDQMPATGQNDRLLKLAGVKIVARGNVFERGGSHAIVIEEIHAAPPAK
jgi:hypothetical protein